MRRSLARRRQAFAKLELIAGALLGLRFAWRRQLCCKPLADLARFRTAAAGLASVDMKISHVAMAAGSRPAPRPQSHCRAAGASLSSAREPRLGRLVVVAAPAL